MTIYVATSGSYSDYHIDSVFTDKRQAEFYCAEHNCWLEEYESDEVRIETKKTPKKIWSAMFTKGGLYNLGDEYMTFLEIEEIHVGQVRISLDASIDKEKAKKIICDKYAQWKAEKEKL